jgi:hypothetical protein
MEAGQRSRTIDLGGLIALQPEFREFWVTEEKIAEAVRRIEAFADPLKIIVSGSRAMRDHRPNSDSDLAVILPCRHSRRGDQQEHHAQPRTARSANSYAVRPSAAAPPKRY